MIMEAEALAVRVGATPSRLTTPQYPQPMYFTGRMPFLPPNQQRQSTEGVKSFLLGWSPLAFGESQRHSQGSEALSLAEWRLRFAMSQNRRRARVETWWQRAAPPANHLRALVTLPLHGSQLLICRVRTPAYIAAGHHIWWSFP